MIGWLINILGFLLAIGILVAVHEFGHFWVARRVGVKVLRFSIGFGKPLIQRVGKDGTEYVVASIPLGGYVKMLDERESEVPSTESHMAFNQKPLWARNAIILAGPVFNFALAILAYWVIAVAGSVEMKPVIGPVISDTPAEAAGFEEGDEILAVNGRTVEAWDQAIISLIRSADGDAVEVTVERRDGRRLERVLDLSQARLLDEEGEALQRIGFQPWRPQIPPVIDELVPGGAAAEAGLQSGERILSVAGEPTTDWADLVEAVGDRPGEEVPVVVTGVRGERTVTVTLQARGDGAARRGVLGVTPDIPEGTFEDMRREVRHGPLAAIPRALDSSWQAGALTVEVLTKMVIGEASVRNLSGPINIAQYAGETVSLGINPFLKFLAIVSISLGIINLLPIPVLDGGHLLYNLIEWVRGRPLSEAAQAFGQQIGIALLLMLMTLAFYNDILRLLTSGG